jgi:transposase
MALKKRVSQLRNQLRAALHLAFPELNPLMKDLTQPTALRFLQAHPSPESILRHGRTHLLAQWQPRQRCGQWRPETFHRISDLATTSIGLQDLARLGECAIKMLADDLVDALTKQHLWLAKAMAPLAHRADYQRLLQLPRIGKPTAAALLTAIGDIPQYTNGTQLVKLAGLDIRLYESGASIRKLPKISHVGSASLRHWLYHYALRLVAHAPHFKSDYERRKPHSPGKGAGQRALMAVCDNAIRRIDRILLDQAPYSPTKDQTIARYYAAPRKAA